MPKKTNQKRNITPASDVTAEDSEGDQGDDSRLEKKKELGHLTKVPPTSEDGKADLPSELVADSNSSAVGTATPTSQLPLLTPGLPHFVPPNGSGSQPEPSEEKGLAAGAGGGDGAATTPLLGRGGPPTIYSAAAPGLTAATGWAGLGIAFRCDKLDEKSFLPFPMFEPGSQYSPTIRYDGITYRHGIRAFMAPDLACQVKLGGLPWDTFVEAVGLMISFELTDDFDMVSSSNGKFKCTVDRIGSQMVQTIADNVDHNILALTDDWAAIKQLQLHDLANQSFLRPSLTTRMYANYEAAPPPGDTVASSAGRRLAGCYIDGVTSEIIRRGLTDASSRWDTPAEHMARFAACGFQVTLPPNMYDWMVTGERQAFVRYRSGQLTDMLTTAQGQNLFIMPREYTLVISQKAQEFNQLFPSYQSVGIPFEVREGISKVAQSSDFVDGLFKSVPETDRGTALTTLGQMPSAFDCKFTLMATFDVQTPATAFPIMLALLMIYPGYLSRQTGVLVQTILMNLGTFQGGLAAGAMTVYEIAAARPQREILQPNLAMRTREGVVYRIGQLMWDMVCWACDPARYRPVMVTNPLGRRVQPVPAPLYQQLINTGVVNQGGFLNTRTLAVNLAATLFSQYRYIGVERMDEAVNRFMPLWAELTGGNPSRLAVSTVQRSPYFGNTILTFYLSMLALSRFPTYGMVDRPAYKERQIEISAPALSSIYFTGDALGKAVSTGTGATKAVATIINSITYRDYRVQLGVQGTLFQLQQWVFAGVQRYGDLRHQMTITPQAYTALMDNWIWRRWDKAKATAPLLTMVEECVEGYYKALRSRVNHPAFVAGFRLQPGETVDDLGLLVNGRPLLDLFYPDGAIRILRTVVRTERIVQPHNVLATTLGVLNVPGELRSVNYGDADWIFYGVATNNGFTCSVANGVNSFAFNDVATASAVDVLAVNAPVLTLTTEDEQLAVAQLAMAAGISVSGTLIESQVGGAIGTLDVGTIIKGCYRQGVDGRRDRIYTSLTAMYASYLSLGREGLIPEAKALTGAPTDMLPFVTIPGGGGAMRTFISVMPNTDVVISDGGKAAPMPPKTFPIIDQHWTETEIKPRITVTTPGRRAGTTRHLVTIGASMTDDGRHVDLVDPIGLECFWRASLEYKELILIETLNGVKR